MRVSEAVTAESEGHVCDAVLAEQARSYLRVTDLYTDACRRRIDLSDARCGVVCSLDVTDFGVHTRGVVSLNAFDRVDGGIAPCSVSLVASMDGGAESGVALLQSSVTNERLGGGQ
jgi:hypothetical protein